MDAAAIDFDDSFIYEEIDLPYNQRKLSAEQILPEEAIVAFEEWKNSQNKIEY